MPSNDVFESIVATAQKLGSTLVVCGLSNKLTPEEQGKLTGDAWERLPEPRPRLKMEVIAPDGRKWEYTLGPHVPRFRQRDLKLMDSIWLELTRDSKFNYLHHYHVVSVALQELSARLHINDRQAALSEKVELTGKRLPIHRIGQQRLKSVSFSIGGREYMAIEQDPGKPSRWGQLAKKGHAVVQFKDVRRNKFIAVAVDGRVKEYGGMARRKHSGTE